jgi:hypothetical protein
MNPITDPCDPAPSMRLARRVLVLALITACFTTRSDWPPPKLPPTPMRIAIAPVDFDPTSYGTHIPPEVRGDLVAWLDGWHQLGVVASPTLDAAKPLPTRVNVFKIDLERIRALCRAARDEHVDAIVFTTFRHGTYDPGSCRRWANEWSTSGNTGDCVDLRPSGRTRETTDLYVRALYPARCVFGRELDLGQDYPTWRRYRDVVRSKLPDYLRGFDTEYEVTDEKIDYCGGADRPACTAPTVPAPAPAAPASVRDQGVRMPRADSLADHG